jgi:hypothetical protein
MHQQGARARAVIARCRAAAACRAGAERDFVTEAAGPTIHVGVSSWIIQDENYGDFTVGQHATFALEFDALEALRPGADGPVRAEHLGASTYRVRARVVFVTEAVWVIDAGDFRAFQERPPSSAQLGALVEGDVYLGIDPFSYVERLSAIPGMPPLSDRWIVQGIELETTPWLEVRQPDGRQSLTRDDDTPSFTQVTATNAWHDDRGHGHYVLNCVRARGLERP